MAISWNQAQKNEKEFWESIYVNQEKDIPSYMPITDEGAMDFTRKIITRFGLQFESCFGKTIADIGCGPFGLIKGFIHYADSKGASFSTVYGIDPLMDFYKTLGKFPSKSYLKLQSSRGESMPIENSCCDMVFSINVVDHVENPTVFINDCRRICKQGGGMYFSVHVVTAIGLPFRPLLFLFDKNHPHHFSEKMVCNIARKIFSDVNVVYRISPGEDHPWFTFSAIFTSGKPLRSIKRWMSTFLLREIYVRCQ